jgi:enolase
MLLGSSSIWSSTGEHREAVELRDGGKALYKLEFECSENVNTLIAEELFKTSVFTKPIDQTMIELMVQRLKQCNYSPACS